MKKIGVLFIVLFLLLSIFTATSSSQFDSSSLEDQVGGIQDKAEELEEFTDEDKFNFLGEKWKEVLLKNQIIAEINSFFTNINWFFVIVFAKDWSFSLQMLFIAMLWLFVLLSLLTYVSIWLTNEWYKALSAILGTILIAHLQIYNYLSQVAIKVIFLKSSAGWSIATSIAIIVLIIVLFFVNKQIGLKIKRAESNRKKLLLQTKVDALEGFKDNLMRGVK